MYKDCLKFHDKQVGGYSDGISFWNLKNWISREQFFNFFLLLFTIYNLNNSYFLHKNCLKFYKKSVGQYSKRIIGVKKFDKFLLCVTLFYFFLLIFTIYNLNNWYFIYKNCKKFQNKQVDQY